MVKQTEKSNKKGLKSRINKKTVVKDADKPVKKPVKKIIKKKEAQEIKERERYFEARGRRKTAVARVRLYTKGTKEFLINDKNFKDYFPNFGFQKTVLAPLEMMKSEDKFRVIVKVRGGGVCAQTEAVRHGLSRALIKFNPDFRKRLKKAGFLTRDSRMRERKKFGLKRARRGPQWSKR